MKEIPAKNIWRIQLKERTTTKCMEKHIKKKIDIELPDEYFQKLQKRERKFNKQYPKKWERKDQN